MGLFDIFSNDNAQQAAADQIAGIQKGYSQLSDLFGQGRGALQTNYAAGLQPFQQNYGTSQQGTTALGNALGLNGQAGNDAAIAAFKNNPGYQFGLDQATQNTLRAAEATGQAASGNTNADIAKLTTNYANQNWNQYIQNLQPYLNYSQGAAGGIGSMYGQLGQGLNQSFTNQGNAAYGAQTSIGNAQANAQLANNNASANMWGALGGLGNLAGNLAGFLF